MVVFSELSAGDASKPQLHRELPLQTRRGVSPDPAPGAHTPSSAAPTPAPRPTPPHQGQEYRQPGVSTGMFWL